MSATRPGILSSLLSLVLLGCAADAAPIEHDAVVVEAGPSAPVAVGEACVVRLQPAWRQGVNCQVVVRCGEDDLFGGTRVGGYAVCDTEGGAFVRALDEVAGRDGDPALDVDLAGRTIAWRDRRDGQTAALRIEGASRVPEPW